MARINGRWRGQLIDAAGFQGTLSAELKGSRGKVSGAYRVSIASHHASSPRSGSIAGKTVKDRLELVLVPDAELDPKVHLRGEMFDCAGGIGIKGIYSVEPRKYSPLVGGIAVMSNDDTRAADEIVVNNPNAAEPRPTPKARTRRKRGK